MYELHCSRPPGGQTVVLASVLVSDVPSSLISHEGPGAVCGQVNTRRLTEERLHEHNQRGDARATMTAVCSYMSEAAAPA